MWDADVFYCKAGIMYALRCVVDRFLEGGMTPNARRALGRYIRWTAYYHVVRVHDEESPLNETEEGHMFLLDSMEEVSAIIALICVGFLLGLTVPHDKDRQESNEWRCVEHELRGLIKAMSSNVSFGEMCLEDAFSLYFCRQGRWILSQVRVNDDIRSLTEVAFDRASFLYEPDEELQRTFLRIWGETAIENVQVEFGCLPLLGVALDLTWE
jgi:hypothetical protein